MVRTRGPSNQRIERVLRAIDEIRRGRMVILVDDEDRENEGDLTLAAEKVTPEAINFMATFGRGLICLALTEERIARLGLQMMAPVNRSSFGTAFTVSVEARHGVTTGISAADRATTIRAVVAAGARPDDLVSPGHVFPLRARKGGVLVRTGQTEGSVDLARLAGLEPAGVICEIMKDDGSMARMPDLEEFAVRHRLAILTVADLIDYRLQSESLVKREVEAVLYPGRAGVSAEFRSYVYLSEVDDTEFLALALGDFGPDDEVLVRVQSVCIPGDVFGSRSCDCGAQMVQALRMMEAEGRGVLVYVNPPRKGSILHDMLAHVMHRPEPPLRRHEQQPAQAQPAQPVLAPALRDFGLGAQVLADLGLRRIRLLSNNPKKIAGLAGYGLEVVARVPIEVPPTTHSLPYLRDKREREGHLLSHARLSECNSGRASDCDSERDSHSSHDSGTPASEG